MTTIIAVQTDTCAVVASDSRITSFDDKNYIYQMNTLASSTPKIATNGKYILGAAGDMRAINILHNAFVPPAPPVRAKGKTLDKFITSKFVPALKDCFELHGYSSSPKDSSDQQDSDILVVVNGYVYVIENDYGWMSDNRGVYAVGTGAAYALGALDALDAWSSQNANDLKRKVTQAMRITAKWDVMTGPPFTVLVQER
jgi:ATP-dependent protease HslVU (ClpYQ) peptidase subunit